MAREFAESMNLNLLNVVLEKGTPTLRGWLSFTNHPSPPSLEKSEYPASEIASLVHFDARWRVKELWSKLSNHVRLHVLYTEGGIYLDTDVEVIKSFAPLLHHKCFVGFQAEAEQVDWVNTAVLGAQPGHPFLQRGMELIRELFAETGEFYRSPKVTTTILKEMGLKEYGLQEIEEVTVYPLEYFYPYPGPAHSRQIALKTIPTQFIIGKDLG